MEAYTNYQKVVEFHSVFGLPVNTEYQTEMFTDDPKSVQLRYDLIDEEYKELLEAYENKDIVEVIDALSDSMYVVYGGAATFGIDFDNIFRSNHTTSDVNLEMFDSEEVNDELHSYEYELEMMQNAMEDKDIYKIEQCFVDFITTVYALGDLFNINLDKSFDMVHRSNMSKTCSSEEEAEQTVTWYKNEYQKNEMSYDTPTWRLSDDGNYYIIYNESTGKILKNINYQAVDLKDFTN